MCGIAGLLAPRMSPAEREALVREMLGCLAHRGPDGDAIWSGEGVTLGIARLAIVATAQPASVIASESGGVRAVVNGEIYNHHALAQGLEGRGHQIGTTLDTAVIVHEYEERGLEFLGSLDGMFAIALWDEPQRRLVVARDRAGEKPLFIVRAGERFAFASEPGALLVLPWVSRDPAPAALARYLVHGFFAGPDSAWESLRQLPPGGMIEVRVRGDRATRWWRPWDALARTPERANGQGDRERVESTAAALEDAVHSRIPAEVPFGVLLSGGVDSSLVAALASRHTRGFPTFSLRMEGAGYDESRWARRVAERFGTHHHEITMGEAEGLEALETFAAGMDQPLGDPSVLPTWAVARLASRHVPVVLTGEGGDELFAGYPTYLGHRHAALAARLPGWANEALLWAARRVRPRDRHISPAHALERFLSTRGLAPFERHLAWFGASPPSEAAGFLAPHLRETLAPGEALGYVTTLARELEAAGILKPGRPPSLVAYQILDLALYLGGGLVTKVDRCAMAHSVESRAPFLRRALIEHALALPESAKLRGGEGKWVLKRIADGLLPEGVAGRRKQGFSPPFSAWARGPLRGRLEDALSPARVRRAGLLDPVSVSALLERHLSGRAECGRTLWTVLSLQMWAERRKSARPTTFRAPSAAPEPAAPGPALPTRS